jgi:hypothetical protein
MGRSFPFTNGLFQAVVVTLLFVLFLLVVILRK